MIQNLINSVLYQILCSILFCICVILIVFICLFQNQKGYSFVAEARTKEQPLASGNWRMRLIGSLPGLPQPLSGEVCSNFITKEIRDYYVPNPKNIIFRFVESQLNIVMKLSLRKIAAEIFANFQGNGNFFHFGNLATFAFFLAIFNVFCAIFCNF